MSVLRFRRLGRLFTAILFSAAAASPAHAAAQPIRIGGTGSGLGVMTALADAFFASRPGVTVTVLPSLGSSGGVRALVDGAIDIAVTSRPLKASEAENHLTELHFSRSPFVLVTSHPNPGSMEADAVPDIFAGGAAHWPDGTPIRIILRPESDTNTQILARYFEGMDQAVAMARTRSDVPTAPTDQDNIQLAEQLPGSLTAASLAQIVVEQANLRVVPVAGIDPTLENLESGAYPLHIDLYLIARAGADGAVADFVTFVQSEDGRRILRGVGSLSSLDIGPAD